MTPAELAKFMSRGRRKNPEDEEPIFMRLDRIVDERAILKDRHAAGHAAAQALQATIDKHETALKKWVHRAEFQKNEAPPVNKAALASPHHLFPRDWTDRTSGKPKPKTREISGWGARRAIPTR